jgi:hypothetical protein
MAVVVMHTVASMGGYIDDAADEVGPRGAAARRAALVHFRTHRAEPRAAHLTKLNFTSRAQIAAGVTRTAQ